MDADVTIGSLGSLKADLIGAVSFDATYVYQNKVSIEPCLCCVLSWLRDGNLLQQRNLTREGTGGSFFFFLCSSAMDSKDERYLCRSM